MRPMSPVAGAHEVAGRLDPPTRLGSARRAAHDESDERHESDSVEHVADLPTQSGETDLAEDLDHAV